MKASKHINVGVVSRLEIFLSCRKDPDTGNTEPWSGEVYALVPEGEKLDPRRDISINLKSLASEINRQCDLGARTHPGVPKVIASYKNFTGQETSVYANINVKREDLTLEGRGTIIQKALSEEEYKILARLVATL